MFLNRYYYRCNGDTLIRRLLNVPFCVYVLCWVVIHYARWLKTPVPFLNNWLTDFICVPMIAHLALVPTRLFLIKNNQYCYPLSYLLLMGAYVSVVFEIVLPLYKHSATADPVDAIAYFAGAFYFYYVHQRADYAVI
jgi:hypothetical protein